MFSTTTPAATPQATPVVTALPLEDALLESIRIIIPDGHVGLTGIRLLQAQQQIIPWDNNEYIIGNDRVIDIPFNGEMTVSGLVAHTYNTGTNVHKHFVEVLIKDLPNPNVLVPTPASAPLIVPQTLPSTADPLSPDALLSTLPDSAALPPLPDSTAGVMANV